MDSLCDRRIYRNGAVGGTKFIRVPSTSPLFSVPSSTGLQVFASLVIRVFVYAAIPRKIREILGGREALSLNETF